MQEIALTPRQICDIECLMNGAFAPLSGFCTQEQYTSILEKRRLPDGSVWPMPINLDISKEQADKLKEGDDVALFDQEGVQLATMTIESLWSPNKAKEAQAVYGSEDETHPGVHYLMSMMGDVYIGGAVKKIQQPHHYDFNSLRRSPEELKAYFKEHGWNKVVAFQTRNPMHRAHQELTIRAAKDHGAHLLIHPVVGMTKPGDVDHYTRVHCYQSLMKSYPKDSAILSLLPIAMRMAGPVEALWHALIRKNYGCTHFIVGRDHAGPGKDKDGNDFYGPYDAQEMVAQYNDDIGIEMVPFQELVYVQERDSYMPVDEVKSGETVLKISGTEFRRMLKSGEDVPSWFSYPGIIAELKKKYPPRHKQGLTLFFTGLSGAGKSTIANALRVRLMEKLDRPITLLDGDIVRQNLSSELGFSKEHRDLNILRIGYVASEITKHRGFAICAPIAPYRATRRKVRDLISEVGAFVEIHVSTSLEVCEGRDRKGLYAKARKGIIKEFTGISDPYETPERAELVIDTSLSSVEQSVETIMNMLIDQGYIRIGQACASAQEGETCLER
jgi:sulfate adenylyltransferase